MKAKSTSFNKTLDKEKCINLFIRYDYYIHSEDDKTLVMRKAGTEFTTDGEKFPKKLSFLFKNEETEVSLKYDGFVLFDTGDLQKDLDLISKRIEDNLNDLVV
ncbi:MAG: hypothetical protein CR986_09680 [Ignavibacteriae bacterium]|nr:MAG: hypothetical protein CR986_09680 [Ignavibacteriota bacterium]